MSEQLRSYRSLTLPEMVTRLRRYAVGLAFDKATCQFGEVAPLVRSARGELSYVLSKLMEEDAAAGRPFLSSLFVSADPYKAEVAGGIHIPNQSFFDMAERLRGRQLYRRFGLTRKAQEIESKISYWRTEVECCYAFAENPNVPLTEVSKPTIEVPFTELVRVKLEIPKPREIKPAAIDEVESLKRVFARRRINQELQN